MQGLPKDLIEYIVGIYVKRKDYQSIARVAQCCKWLHRIVQPRLRAIVCTYVVYAQFSDEPHIEVWNCDRDNDVCHSEPIGNYTWVTQIKHPCTNIELMFDDDQYVYGRINDIELYHEQPGKTKNFFIHEARTLTKTFIFRICHHVPFGQLMQVVWWRKYGNHGAAGELYSCLMTWTVGDVWIAMIVLPTQWRNNIYYRYEICVDHGGPVVAREETLFRNGSNKIKQVEQWQESSSFCLNDARSFSIHYHAQPGQRLEMCIDDDDDCYRRTLTWTKGDVWIMILENVSLFIGRTYWYEVVDDDDDATVHKEVNRRVMTKLNGMVEHISTFDVWDVVGELID